MQKKEIDRIRFFPVPSGARQECSFIDAHHMHLSSEFINLIMSEIR